MTYVGATRLVSPEAGLSLTAAWAWQPKLDGCYAVARLDSAGRIASVTSRTGRELPEGADLLGLLAGQPDSVVVGELEAHTEAGASAAARQGYRRLHLFDALRADGVDLSALPYVERWGALHRMQSVLEGDGAARVESWHHDGYGRPHGPSGRFCRRVPVDLRRLPIVPLLRSPSDARQPWRQVEAGALEGLVAVRLDAPAGRRDSKRKIKLTDTLDCRVVAVSPRVVRVAARGGSTQRAWRDRPTFAVGASGLRVGQVVEVAHHGYYATGEPRFPRVVRERTDLAPVGPAR